MIPASPVPQTVGFAAQGVRAPGRGHQPQVGLVCAQHCEFAAPPLGGRFVVAMQYQSVAGGPATGQPVDGAWVAVEPVVIAHTRSHQQRYRHRAGVHFRAERVDIGQGALTYPRDRHEQFSRHACSLPIPGFRTVKDTRTAGVYLDPDQRRTSARRLGARAMTRRRNQAPPDILARYP